MKIIVKSNKTRQVYNGPLGVKSVTVILSV